MISASSRNRWRLAGSSAWRSRICLSATSRLQLGVEGHEDGAQAAAGVGPEDAEPLAVGGGRADGVAGGAVGVAIGLGGGEPTGEGALDLGVAQARRATRGWTARRGGRRGSSRGRRRAS